MGRDQGEVILVGPPHADVIELVIVISDNWFYFAEVFLVDDDHRRVAQ